MSETRTTRGGPRSSLLPALAVAALALLLISAPTGEARRSRCSAGRDQQMDAYAAHLSFLGDHSFRVPQNLSRMGEFCGQLRESVGGIQNYARDCLQGFTRQILNSLMKRGKQQHSTICQSNESKSDFMNKLACLRDTNNIQTFHRLMDASVARFEFISSKSVAGELKLPALCCSYQIFFQDMDATLRRICGQSGRREGETGKFVLKFVTGTTGEFLNLICEDHRSMEDCQKSAKTRDSLRQLQELTAKVREGKLSPKGKSLIPPLLDILDASS